MYKRGFTGMKLCAGYANIAQITKKARERHSQQQERTLQLQLREQLYLKDEILGALETSRIVMYMNW